MTNSHTRRWLALVAIGLSMLAVGLDMTVLNTALPTLATDLDASNSQLQWFADSYLLVLAGAILPVGLLGDRYGHKRVLIGGLLLFAAGSAWCALSTSAGELIAARTLLGFGAAIITPLAISIQAVLFEPHERQKAIAIASAFTMVGIPLGPIISGVMLQHFAWGWVFALNLPLAAIALVAVVMLVPHTRGARGTTIDLPGIVVSVLGLVGVSYGLIEGPAQGWSSVQVLAPLLAGLALLAALVPIERRAAHPLLDLSLFSSRAFTSGTLAAAIVSFAMFGIMFVLPQLFQAVGGAGPLGTGLRSLPMVGGLILGFQLGNRISPRLGVTPTMVTGFTVMALGAGIGTMTGVASGFVFVAVWSAVFGFGTGLSLPTAMTAALNAMSRERAGAGSSMLMAARQAASVIGVALLGTVLSAGYRAALPEAAGEAVRSSASAGVAVAERSQSPGLLEQVQQAFASGMGTTLWVCVGVAMLGVVTTVVMLRRRAPAPTEQGQSQDVARV